MHWRGACRRVGGADKHTCTPPGSILRATAPSLWRPIDWHGRFLDTSACTLAGCLRPIVLLLLLLLLVLRFVGAFIAVASWMGCFCGLEHGISRGLLG